MENSVHQKRKKISAALLLLFVSAAFARPQLLYAEGSGNAAVINTDEDGIMLSYPSFVYADPVMKEIYVIDGRNRIIIYTSDFFPLFTMSKRNGLENPTSLAVDEKGNVYVTQSVTKDEPRGRISVYNACLKWERDIFLSGFEGSDTFIPYRIVLDNKGNIYVAGNYFPGAIIINSEGKFLDILSPEEDGRKVKVNDVTLDKEGNIYLLSEEDGHVYVYDKNRKFLFKFGDKGGSSGKLSRPRAVAVDDFSGEIYVVDYMRHMVIVYDKKGKFISEFGGMGLGEGWFQYPTDVTVDFTGRILVSDTFNNRIQVFGEAK